MGWEILPIGCRLHDGNWTDEELEEFHKGNANLDGFTSNSHRHKQPQKKLEHTQREETNKD